MTIKEAAETTGMTPDTLRYYEKIGLLPKVPRTAGGIRDYGSREIGWIKFIHCMRRAGLPVNVLLEYADLCLLGDDTVPRRQAILQEQRELLQAKIGGLQESLTILEKKIDQYENVLLACERKL